MEKLNYYHARTYNVRVYKFESLKTGQKIIFEKNEWQHGSGQKYKFIGTQYIKGKIIGFKGQKTLILKGKTGIFNVNSNTLFNVKCLTNKI